MRRNLFDIEVFLRTCVILPSPVLVFELIRIYKSSSSSSSENKNACLFLVTVWNFNFTCTIEGVWLFAPSKGEKTPSQCEGIILSTLNRALHPSLETLVIRAPHEGVLFFLKYTLQGVWPWFLSCRRLSLGPARSCQLKWAKHGSWPLSPSAGRRFDGEHRGSVIFRDGEDTHRDEWDVTFYPSGGENEGCIREGGGGGREQKSSMETIRERQRSRGSDAGEKCARSKTVITKRNTCDCTLAFKRRPGQLIMLADLCAQICWQNLVLVLVLVGVCIIHD